MLLKLNSMQLCVKLFWYSVSSSSCCQLLTLIVCFFCYVLRRIYSFVLCMVWTRQHVVVIIIEDASSPAGGIFYTKKVNAFQSWTKPATYCRIEGIRFAALCSRVVFQFHNLHVLSMLQWIPLNELVLFSMMNGLHLVCVCVFRSWPILPS